MTPRNKPPTQTDSNEALTFFSGVSKAWLVDVVVDLVRRNTGDEQLDGLELVDTVTREAHPITSVRDEELALVRAFNRAFPRESRERHAKTHIVWKTLGASPEVVHAPDRESDAAPSSGGHRLAYRDRTYCEWIRTAPNVCRNSGRIRFHCYPAKD